MRQKVEQLGGLAAVGNEEQNIVLKSAVSYVYAQMIPAKSTYLSDITKVAVGCLGGMQKGGRDAQTFERRDSLSTNKTALAHAANKHLSSLRLRLGDTLDCPKQSFPGTRVCLV